MHSFEQQLDAAVTCHARGDLKNACRIYEELLSRQIEHPTLYRQLGIARIQQLRLDEALRWLERSAKLAVDPQTQGWIGEALRRQGHAAKAIPYFEACLAALPTFAPGAFNLGLAYDEIGRPELAARAWTTFLSLRPRDPNIRRELGRLAYRRGDFVEARGRFNDQLAEFPHDHVAVVDLAQTLIRLDDCSTAIELLSCLDQEQPPENRVLALLGEAHEKAGDFQACIDVSLRAADLESPNVRLCMQIARSADRFADLPMSIAWFGRALQLDPLNADICNSLAVAHLNFGEVERSVELFLAPRCTEDRTSTKRIAT